MIEDMLSSTGCLYSSSHVDFLVSLFIFIFCLPVEKKNRRSIWIVIRAKTKIFRIPAAFIFIARFIAVFFSSLLKSWHVQQLVKDRQLYFGSGRALSILLLGCASSSIRMFAQCVCYSFLILFDSQSFPFYFFSPSFLYFYFYTYSAHCLLPPPLNLSCSHAHRPIVSKRLLILNVHICMFSVWI